MICSSKEPNFSVGSRTTAYSTRGRAFDCAPFIDLVLVVLLMSNPNKCVDKSEAIVAVFARVSLAAIASCEDDIDHLTYRDEVDAVFSSVFLPFYQFLKEVLDTRPEHCHLISGFHPVAMKFDKEPIRPPLDSDCRLLPELQSVQIWRVVSGQFAALDAGQRPAALTAPKVDHEWPLNNQWESARSTAALQVKAPAMGCSLVQRKGALVERVDLANLRRGACGKSEIGVAAGVGQDLHFFVHAAKTPVVRICQGPIAMYEGVSRRAGSVLSGKAAAGGQGVSELHERSGRVLCRVRSFHTMMQMNLNFSPAFMTVFRQAVNQRLIVILSRIKIRVA